MKNRVCRLEDLNLLVSYTSKAPLRVCCVLCALPVARRRLGKYTAILTYRDVENLSILTNL